MENSEVQKSKIFNVLELVEYTPKTVVVKSLIKRPTGSIRAVSVDSGENLSEKISPFDTFIQIIEGSAEILINDFSQTVKRGHSIIIPAHSKNIIRAHERFKMIITIIKSGYE